MVKIYEFLCIFAPSFHPIYTHAIIRIPRIQCHELYTNQEQLIPILESVNYFENVILLDAIANLI